VNTAGREVRGLHKTFTFALRDKRSMKNVGRNYLSLSKISDANRECLY